MIDLSAVAAMLIVRVTGVVAVKLYVLSFRPTIRSPLVSPVRVMV